jgi:hypothetical protein
MEQAELSTALSDEKPEEKEEKLNIKSEMEQILTTRNVKLLKSYSQKLSPKRDGEGRGGVRLGGPMNFTNLRSFL